QFSQLGPLNDSAHSQTPLTRTPLPWQDRMTKPAKHRRFRHQQRSGRAARRGRTNRSISGTCRNPGWASSCRCSARKCLQYSIFIRLINALAAKFIDGKVEICIFSNLPGSCV
ncbi:hypothetical protein PMAYCL1PPCAC_05200, partial [Pristionchus mayeri]